MLNLGWTWNNASSFIAEQTKNSAITSAKLTSLVIEKCKELYLDRPGDDTTVANIKIIPRKTVNIFTGPPQNPEDDENIVGDFLSHEGFKIVSGGISANILSRITGEEIKTTIEYADPTVPPIAYIKGIDLVTEGVLTLKKVTDILKAYFKNPTKKSNISALEEKHGAAMMAKVLAEECTHINLFVGKKINPAHQNPNMPAELNIRTRVVGDLCDILTEAGKIVKTKYY